ncbi:aromatase/cyclase [Streptomyces sp. B-S-A8]|uniref:Aromatase/cyclase n=1 Tax=Streptomyces solicavernae TaxID=3043614 RepID=A0ABT6RZM4_9ACTN|nr:aromatase/cyclase [Streptomyces sp. B-S-A8]MDI3389878.1 aromatase/cyclase [Streptomyces sp. B-S-A8]
MTTREVEHEITVAAPAARAYRLLADVESLPQIFPPTIFVEQTERTDNEERIRVWATANGEAVTWSTRRTLDEQALRISFEQDVSPAPIEAMTGTYVIEPVEEDRCRVRLLFDYRAVDDDPESLTWIDQAVDENARSQLASLKSNLEQAHADRDLTLVVEDTVRVNGSAKDAYDFINEAQLWGERLPHVAAVRLVEDSAGLQTLEMDISVADGRVHTTKAYRVCFPNHKIAYKAVRLPELLTLHTGQWEFEEDGDGVLASARHMVVLNADGIAEALGPQTTVADARKYLHDALSTNSRVTLAHAKAYAEGRR